MKIEIATSWRKILDLEFKKPYFQELTTFVKQEYDTNLCFPPVNKLYEAFSLCALEDLKVVIIGQDPYHGKGQANGLCFSVMDNIKQPPSLKNIFKLVF